MGTYKYCICFTRKFRWREAEPPADVRSAFAAFSGGGAHMSSDQLRQFLSERQGEAGDEADRILDRIPQTRYRHHIGVEDFHHYLFDVELNPPIRSQVHFLRLT